MKNLLSILTALLVLVGCQSPLVPVTLGGQLILIPDSGSGRSLGPNFSLALTRFDITLSRSGYADIVFKDAGPTGVSSSTLDIGLWNVQVTGKNSLGYALATGSTSVQVASAATTTCTVKMSPLAGQGTLTLELTWPEGTLTDPSYEASLALVSAGVEATPDPLVLNFNALTRKATLNKVVDTGVYILRLRLLDKGVAAWGTKEAVFVVKDQTTAGVYNLDTDHMNYPPEPPSALKVINFAASAIRLGWSDNSEIEASTSVEKKTGATGTWTKIATLGRDVSTYLDTSIVSTETYYYRIQSSNLWGASAYSNEIQAKLPLVSALTGSIVRNRNLTNDQTYEVEGVLTISGAELTIDPGTVLQFKGGAGLRFTAGGKLTARGTAANPIVFTAANSKPDKGFWNDIVFEATSSDDSVLDNAVLLNGRSLVVQDSFPALGNLRMEDMGAVALNVQFLGENDDTPVTWAPHDISILRSGDQGVVFDSRLTGQRKITALLQNFSVSTSQNWGLNVVNRNQGVKFTAQNWALSQNQQRGLSDYYYSRDSDWGGQILVQAAQGATSILDSTVLDGKWDGIVVRNFDGAGPWPFQVDIRRTRIERQTARGLHLRLPNLTGTSVVLDALEVRGHGTYAGSALDADFASQPALISASSFEGNSGPSALLLDRANQVGLYGNTFYNTATYELRTKSAGFTARYNYWGPRALSDLAALVYDRNNTAEPAGSALGTIVYDPYFASPGSFVRATGPVAGETVKDVSVPFTWEVYGTAKTVRLQIATDSAFTSPSFDRSTLTGAGFLLAGADRSFLAPETMYYWRTAAIYTTGEQGPWGNVETFQLPTAGVLLDLNVLKDPHLAITGVNSIVFPTESLTLGATADRAMDEYRWTLNGTVIADTVQATQTVQPLKEGYYQLTLAARLGAQWYSASKAFQVQSLNVQKLFPGRNRTYVLRNDGLLYGWGDEGAYNLGNQVPSDKNLPFKINYPSNLGGNVDFTGLDHVAGNDSATYLKYANGDLYSLGSGLGVGEGAGGNVDKPRKILSSVASVTGAGQVGFAIKTDGTLWGWGNNLYFGALGMGLEADSSLVNFYSPTQVTLSGVTRVATSGQSTLAVTSNGKLYGWGYNKNNALGLTSNQIPVISDYIVSQNWGDGTRTWKLQRVGATSIRLHFAYFDAQDSYSSYSSTLNIAKPDGTVLVSYTGNKGAFWTDPLVSEDLNLNYTYSKYWSSSYGRGWLVDSVEVTSSNGTVTVESSQTTVPVEIKNGPQGAISLATTTENSSFAVDQDGRLWTWGAWQSGLNLSPLGDLATPKASRYTGVKTVASADGRAWILYTDGTLAGWGTNTDGHLGFDSQGEFVGTPTAFLTDVAAFQASTGRYEALKKDGTVWTWGSNDRKGRGLTEQPANRPGQVRW